MIFFSIAESLSLYGYTRQNILCVGYPASIICFAVGAPAWLTSGIQPTDKVLYYLLFLSDKLLLNISHKNIWMTVVFTIYYSSNYFYSYLHTCRIANPKKLIHLYSVLFRYIVIIIILLVIIQFFFIGTISQCASIMYLLHIPLSLDYSFQFCIFFMSDSIIA